MRKIVIAILILIAAAFAVPAPAAAMHGFEGMHCDQSVRRVRVKSKTLVYVVRGTFPDGVLHYGRDFSWDWVYAETNGIRGLQRSDADCESGAALPDTVIASTELWCTCGYPFGYPPFP